MGRLAKLKRELMLESNKIVLGEDTGEEITREQMMDATRMDDNMKLIGPDGNEIPVQRTIIDGIDVKIFGYADAGNNNDEYELTLGDPINQTYKGRYLASEDELIIDVPNSKYMIKINLVGPEE